MKRYRFGLDWWGLALFLLVMAPNLVWFLVPAPSDVLRLPSRTPVLDTVASVVQIFLVASLCLLRRMDAKVPDKNYILPIVGTLVGYWICWACYYGGTTCPIMLLAMCVLPCASLLLWAAFRRNRPALVFGSLFLLLHGAYGVLNFLY